MSVQTAKGAPLDVIDLREVERDTVLRIDERTFIKVDTLRDLYIRDEPVKMSAEIVCAFADYATAPDLDTCAYLQAFADVVQMCAEVAECSAEMVFNDRINNL